MLIKKIYESAGRMSLPRRLVAALMILASACMTCLTAVPDASAGPAARVIVSGRWGGTHVEMKVTAKGASVEFDCAQGTLDEPLVLDGAGHFQVKGTFSRRGGPTKLNPASGENAIYAGSVRGDSMTLQLSIGEKRGDKHDENRQPETFTLVRGQAGDLRRCY